MATTRQITDADLLRLPKDGQKRELVDGEIRVSPAGLRHEGIVVRLILELGGFVVGRGLGQVFGSSAGFRLPGGNVRSPDVSFVSAGRFPGPIPKGFGELAPDLAVEVLSPDDDAREALDKVGEYLRAGVRLVWVIDPETRRAASYRSLTSVHEVDAQDGELDGQDVVPGFRCRLAEILD